jgi:hypothetical protein
MPTKIEDFLDYKIATSYSLKNHHFIRVMREVFGTTEALFKAFTKEILESEKFRNDLWSCLGPDVDARPKVADRWVMFLKPRINVLESWSGMCTAFAALYGLASTLFTLVGFAVGKPADIGILILLVLFGVLLVSSKFYIDKRAFWYKFVVAHLEAIAKRSNPPLNTDAAPKSGAAPVS